jgi:hypothetical protein
MTHIYTWSKTPATNANADSAINMAEFMNPDLVNDGIRQLMARVAEWRLDLGATLTTGGTGNAYTLITNSVISAYPDGFTVWFTADRANGGGSTLAINGLAAIPLRGRASTSLPANSILAGGVYGAVYRAGTNEFILCGSNAGLYELAPALMSAQVFGLRVGSPALSIAPSPDAGFVRLTEATQSLVKTDYPELNTVVSGWGYPWGSTSTTFNLPPAAGYFPRFAATSSSIDPGGARAAGSTQTDLVGGHTHAVSGAASGSIGVVSTANNIQYNTTISEVQTGPGVQVPQSNAGAVSSTGNATLTVTGTAATNGGAETRPKNVAVHLDILAKPALVATELIGVAGLVARYSTQTADADPGAGYFRLNNAAVASATQIFYSETDYFGSAIAGIVNSWDDVGTSQRGRLRFVKIGAPSVYLEYRISGAITDAGPYAKIPVVYIGNAGTFADTDRFHVQFSPAGDQGVTGASGSDGGIRWTWSTTTTMADPGSGTIRLNNAILGSATAFAISALTGESGNPSAAGWISTWDDSTTTARRGTLTLRKATGTQNFVILDITSVLTDNSTWQTASCAVRQAQGSFSNGDTLLVSFSPAGDKGLDGAGSGTLTSITLGAGLGTAVGSSGGTITVSGTAVSLETVNAQSGTAYTVLASDHTKTLTLSNTASVAVTLPQATGSFGSGFYFDAANLNVGVVTITPTVSTINGASSLILNRFQSVRIVSDGTNWQVLFGGSLRAQTTNVASAATCDIGATPSHRISVTGTTTITSFGTVPNELRNVTFAGALTLTHNATTLILPGAANITTAAGDYALASSDSSGNWRVLAYNKADGTPVVGGSSGSPSSPQGRLTLTTLTPVMTASTSSATTIYYTPYIGRFVPLYNGSTWTMTDVGGELSQATTDAAKSPAACAANSNYDLFVWNDSGIYRLSRGPLWSSDTARGTGAGSTELARVNGILVNANSISIGLGGPIAANRGTYVGTIRTNGSSAIDATQSRLMIWNNYNRITTTVTASITSTHTYTTSSWRAWNTNTTVGQGRIEFLVGVVEDQVVGIASFQSSNSTASDSGYMSAGLNTTTSSSVDQLYTSGLNSGSTIYGLMANGMLVPSLGYNYMNSIELGQPSSINYITASVRAVVRA